MAIASLHVLERCDGFCVEAGGRSIGWVEETWLGVFDEPAALALRLLDGRRGLVLARDVAAVLPEREHVLVRDGARVLELAPPHLVREGVATWETTGTEVDAQDATIADQAVLELRPWRLRPARTRTGEQPMARVAVMLLAALALLIGLEITVAFAVAYLVTGRAY
jgi:hypothetical protein